MTKQEAREIEQQEEEELAVNDSMPSSVSAIVTNSARRSRSTVRVARGTFL